MHTTLTPLEPASHHPSDSLPATAPGNTRLNYQLPDITSPFHYSLDYLKVVGYTENIDDIQALILKYFYCEFDWSNNRAYKHGREIYSSSARTPNGILLAYKYHEDGVSQLVIELSGTPLRELSEECGWNFCKELQEMGLRCTRFDFAIDDYTRSLDFRYIKLACEAGNFSGVLSANPFITYLPGKRQLLTGFACGSRQSEAYLRIYDKLIESLGRADEADCIRVEGEFKGSKAEQLFHLYCDAETPELALEIGASHTIGIVDFVHKIHHNLDRCPRLPFWSAFVNLVGLPKRLRSIVLVRTVETIVNFIDRQVKRSLALLQVCQGDIWLDHQISEWLRLAKKKFSHKERKFIERHNRLVTIDPDLALPTY